jgi:hypothetical protein
MEIGATGRSPLQERGWRTEDGFMDTLLLDFIGQNYVTIYVCLRVLKGLAVLSKTTTDDKIATMLMGVWQDIMGRGKRS